MSATAPSDFQAAMLAAGIEYNGQIIGDGTLRRVKINGDRNSNAWYVLHQDGIAAGMFGCWKRGIKEKWCAKSDTELTPEERAERDRRWQQQKEIREAERHRQQDDAARTAEGVLSAAQPATDDHPYLQRKQVRAYPGVLMGAWSQRRANNCLLIPLRTAAGKLASVQAIFSEKRGDRDKDFLKGGAKTGAYFVIGDLEASPVILIAEGYATAATLHAATGHAAVMACDAGNLAAVAAALKAIYPHPQVIMICGDSDRHTDGNPGRKAALAASKKAKVRVCLPAFADDDEGSDFNDLAALHGMDRVFFEVESALTGPWMAGKVGQPHDPAMMAETVSALAGQDEESCKTLRLPTVSPCTHLANSHRIRHYYKGRIWYALGVGWVMWTGQFWRSDPTSEGAIATGFIDGLSRRIAAEAGEATRLAAEETSTEKRKSLMERAEALIKWAVQSENERVIAAGLKLTKHALLIEYGALNADPWLFNVQNGTIDLRTGKLRPHNPADLITFLSPVTHDPAATCPTWTRFLLEVFAGDADMVAFIQRAVGWSLTGVVKERALFFLHGSAGKNGKTTLVEAIMKLAGTCGETSYGYGRKVGADTFMKSRNSDDNQRKAATLAGPRFICTSEVDEDHRLDEQLVKDITGGDTLEGRRLYQEAFTFKPQFKAWMYGNHKPEIRGTDDAIWSRVRLVPFNVSFKGREDLELADKLEVELSGILNWAIQGCLDWQRRGLQPPAKVEAATQAYRDEMDVFGPFIAERCVIHRAADVRASDLWNAYKAWCEESGAKEQTQTKFGKYLSANGFIVERSNGIRRIGIGLLDIRHSDSGRVGTVGIDMRKSPIGIPHKGICPPNPSNHSNHSNPSRQQLENPDIPADISSTTPAATQSPTEAWADKTADTPRDNPRQPAEPAPTGPDISCSPPDETPRAKLKYREVFN